MTAYSIVSATSLVEESIDLHGHSQPWVVEALDLGTVDQRGQQGREEGTQQFPGQLIAGQPRPFEARGQLRAGTDRGGRARVPRDGARPASVGWPPCDDTRSCGSTRRAVVRSGLSAWASPRRIPDALARSRGLLSGVGPG